MEKNFEEFIESLHEMCGEFLNKGKLYTGTEQKPVDNEKVEITDFEQSVYDLCPVLGIEEAKATASDLLELAKKTLLKTGEVVLASNYPEGCSFEDGFHLGYNEGFNAKQEQKPAEWSEEDENALECFHELIVGSTEKFCDAQTASDMRKWLNTRLRSLSHFYELGKKDMKEQMLKDAVEGEVCKYGDTPYFKEKIKMDLTRYLSKFDIGDRGKLIIVKED